MKAVQLRRVATATGLGLLALAGCAKTAPPPEFVDYAVRFQQAQILSSGCPQVSLDRAALSEGAVALGQELGRQGYSQSEIEGFRSTLDTSQVDAAVRSWVAAEGIDATDPATVCPVAERALAADSDAAAFIARN